MNTELRIVRLKYSVIECYLSYSFNSIQFARTVNKKNKTAHPKRADGFMASAFADRANRTGREVGIYDFLRKSNESLQIPHLNVFGDKGNTCHSS